MVKPSDIRPRPPKPENAVLQQKPAENVPPKKPFVRKPHLTDKIGRTNPQLNELRKSLSRKNQPNVRVKIK